MVTSFLAHNGPLIDQSLSAAIAVITGSFFLYSLVRDIGNQVGRVYSILLLFVLITYIGDLGVGYSNDPWVAEAWLRFQWLGIAFVPAAYVHLSHIILTRTGVQSRGRRVWTVRLLYVVAAVFLGLSTFTNLLVRDMVADPAPHFEPGPVFPVFVVYFAGSVVVSLWFVLRARRRTLIEATRRRMNFLVFPYVAPALSVFPFLLISGRVLSSPLAFYAVLILVDGLLAAMLSYLSYSMAFIGALLPERLIKAQMLQFFLRGPVVAIAALAVIVWVPRAGGVLGLPGDEIMPFLAVVVILFMQWAITIIRPHLEGWLIYGVDQMEVRRIQELEQRLLTGADFRQLLDTILTALCDFLHVDTAFVATVKDSGPHLERAIGLHDEFFAAIEQADVISKQIANGTPPEVDEVGNGGLFAWEGFWLIPLHAENGNGDAPRLIGVLGVLRPAQSAVDPDADQLRVIMALATRAAEVLEDRRIQSQVVASLEGLLPEMTTIERMREAARHGGYEALAEPTEELLSGSDFSQRIKDALTHYWGGPDLTDAALMRLAVVREALDENDGNPQRAMRAVLLRAIESLRPEGQRSMTTAEWILYNILEMRFVQGRKVRDVAMRLAMSESDLYRKQRVAIEAVAELVADMERATVADQRNGSALEKQPTPQS
jgi:hypothetical protein